MAKGKIPSSLKNPDKAEFPVMRKFGLYRTKDVSGTSGSGLVACGVIFPSGHAVLEWLSVVKSCSIFQSIADLEHIHGHEGATKLVFHEGD